MPLFLFLLSFLFILPAARATDLDDFLVSDKNHVDSNWRGIFYQILLIQRMPPNRIVVGLYLKADARAPANGILIGVPVKIPPWASAEQIRMNMFHPLPYSFKTSVLTDDLSKTTYPALAPIRFGSQIFLPGGVMAVLRPYQSRIISLQFACPPPPPPPPPGQPPKKQTVSILFTNAVAPIAHIPIPPPDLQYGAPGSMPK